MADCRDVEPFFASYVDGEAELQKRVEVDTHLLACPPCRDRVAGERAAREVVRARRERLRPCASGALRARCAAQASPRPVSAAPVPPRVSRPWLPLSLAATLALAVGGVFFLGLNNSVEALAAQLALDHVKCFQFPPANTVQPDAAELGAEWERARGWAVQIPPSAANHRLELVGIRRCASTEGITAHMMYKWRDGPLSVYVLDSTAGRLGEAGHFVRKLGQEAVIWEKDGRTYAVVARGHASELEPVVKYVKVNAR